MVNRIFSDGSFSGDVSLSTRLILRKLSQQHAKYRAEDNSSVTDNSGGSADAERDIVLVQTAFENVADSGTSLAQEADTQASLLNVKDALATLFAVTNDIANDLGLSQVTYSGGGTDGTGTVAAIDDTITAAATGVQATEVNVIRLALNNALYTLAVQVNDICDATGVSTLDLSALTTEAYQSTVAAIDHTATGTAADPGIAATAMQTALDQYSDDIATIAARVNVVVSTADPYVVGGQ